MNTNIDFNLGTCNPTQIINITNPQSVINNLTINDNCNQAYDNGNLLFAYSLDSICWSCYMTYDELLKNTIDLNSDFYLRFKINNIVGDIYNDDEKLDYSSQLSSSFELPGCKTDNPNVFNPYANLDSAINLQSQLTETVSCLFGIPIYYFKLKPDSNSKDLTFKEYALMGVDQVKQIKLIITDGTMPSSKPEFADFGLDYQTDWETEISKATFATAFGNTAQPMEGDFIYIPMMKRMWQVSGAYEEKNGSLMWNATTFKVMLVKYQEKGSVDLQETESLVNSLVKNKYDDLFGEDNNSTLDAETENLYSPVAAQNNLYPVFESDALRKYVTCDTISFENEFTYFKGTLISDMFYNYVQNGKTSKIIYQNKYCGATASVSFIIKPIICSGFDGIIAKVGNCEIRIRQNGIIGEIYTNIYPDKIINVNSNTTYFIVVRWDMNMNLFDISGYEYTYNKQIPMYKLTSGNYYYDIDNPVAQHSLQYSVELTDEEGHDVYISNFYGKITNFKVFDIYNDNISELLQMYPTHQHLLINDTARRLNGKDGVILK